MLYANFEILHFVLYAFVFFLSPNYDKMLDVSNLLCVFMLDLTYFCVSVSLANVYNPLSTTMERACHQINMDSYTYKYHCAVLSSAKSLDAAGVVFTSCRTVVCLVVFHLYR